MAAGLILQFPQDVGEKEYAEVNSKLGIDMKTGSGDWPAGLLSHSAGVSDEGLVVTEIWESKEAQAAFMESRLGGAFQEVGITPPSRIVWYEVLASQNK